MHVLQSYEVIYIDWFPEGLWIKEKVKAINIEIIVGTWNDASSYPYMLLNISKNLGTFACILLFGLHTQTIVAVESNTLKWH